MGVSAVLATSVVFLFAAALLAINLIRVTGRKVVWIVLAAAILLMAYRNELTYARLVQGGDARPAHMAGEWVVLCFSFLLMVGLLGVTSLFRVLKRSAEAARESERRFRAIFETSLDAIALYRGNGHLMVNPAYLSMFGYADENEVLARPIEDFVEPAQRAFVRERVELCLKAAQRPGAPRAEAFETKGIRKDGTIFDVETRMSACQLHGESHLVAIVRDITSQKRAKLALTQQSAELRARNDELDAFAHTVAHDLKNPLTTIAGSAETLNRLLGPQATREAADLLRAVALGSRRACNIVDELLLFAQTRKSPVALETLEMSRIVDGALRRLDHPIKESSAEIVLPPSWPQAMGHGPWVEEVWYNYLSNALKYGGNPPRVKLGAVPLPNGMVRFWVQDNGPGIPPEAQERLFAPFAHLEQVGTKGHGLGLSIVRRIVERLGGRVGGEILEDQGSVFSFTLPEPPK